MKTLVVICLSLLSALTLPKDKIQWDRTEYDFGTIQQGETVSTLFKFKNLSDTLFQIENVLTSCGCTATEWSRERYEAGDSGSIKVTFNSKEKNKQHEKVVSVLTSHGEYELIIKVNITKP